VQNDPTDPDRVIIYTALEGDEAATYTRGTAKLIDGEARVPLGDTFKWVTNPAIGLTVHLTPRGRWADLYVVSVSTNELVVASHDSASDAVFDYIVYGLRIGFEEISVVREKNREAHIPSMAAHDESYEKHPELRHFNALERFKAMQAALGDLESLDFREAHALRDAITVYDAQIQERAAGGSKSRSTPMGQARPDDTTAETHTLPQKGDEIGEQRDAAIEALKARLEQLETIVAELSSVHTGEAQ